MSEKFSLKWNDYQSNWNKTIHDLRKDTDLADVTLISDDKVKFSAHKILLSSCSNMFKFILQSNTHLNPMMFLGGIDSVNLGYILDYIYHGEVNLYQKQLDSFLESAQKLEIKGLLGNIQGSENHVDENMYTEPKENLKDEHTYYQPPEESGLMEVIKNQPLAPRRLSKDHVIFNVGSLTQEEISQKMKELYEKTDNGWRCLACDHTNTGLKSSNMRTHVETHLEGLCYTCNMCHKEFRSRKLLNLHNFRSHKN